MQIISHVVFIVSSNQKPAGQCNPRLASDHEISGSVRRIQLTFVTMFLGSQFDPEGKQGKGGLLRGWKKKNL